MGDESMRQTTTRVACRNCGFEAPTGSDEWETAAHPSHGTLTRCPDCGSTNTTGR
ncbi:DNA repair protein RadA [Haloplanus halobius]|uniref:DNA repair protein RadA n=1 Tax=Haloplanus halobius TaxID=2934938 RepID=UPI00200E2C9A|nr:DNA repair protein RadA [Haloplanus sp. XH21]